MMLLPIVLLGLFTVSFSLNSQTPRFSSCSCTCNANQNLRSLEAKLQTLLGLNNKTSGLSDAVVSLEGKVENVSDAVKFLEAKVESLIGSVNRSFSLISRPAPKPSVQPGRVIKRNVSDDVILAKLRDIERILGAPCLQGWVRFNGYCYLVCSSFKTWQNAQAYCKGLGGNLVKINSKEENEFVLNLVNKLAPSLKQIWIGLEWDSRVKAFVWYDHSVPSFTKWAPLEPNGKAGEPFGLMWTGYAGISVRASGDWNDVAGGQFGLVCKKLP